MAGRIREEDIAEVRERARIDDVVSAYVTLRNAGGGSQKGLCPFHDEKSPSFQVTPSRGLYYCLAGETQVLTFDGPRPIRELAGRTHRVLGPRADWVDAPFRSYGVQPLMKITLTRNRQVKVIHATPEHRWFVRSGKEPTARREVITSDLRPGALLSYTYPRSTVQNTTPSPFGIAQGFTFGDGTRAGRGSHALICPPKDSAMLKYFPLSTTSAAGDNLLVLHLPGFFKDLPSLDESTSFLYGWLAGYFAADGRVSKDGTVMLSSAHREHLQFVRDVCTRLGIATYGITSQLREGFPGREPTELFRVHLVNSDLTESFFLIPEHARRFAEQQKAYARLGWTVQSVEPTDRVEEVFCAEVEDGHAFVLEDNILTGNCFGCGAGGDVIKFVMEMDGLGFTETVERLADKSGVQLRYEEGDAPFQRSEGSMRPRLLAANAAAEQFYAEQLHGPSGQAARQFLDERGFDAEAAARFGIGFSPRGGEDLFRHLKGRGYTDKELLASGLVREGRGFYDFFRGRVMWPIREANGDTIGFGARRIFDDDRIAAKYLNTGETPVYKKSRVLYGLDLARAEIGRSSQAVIVEGYTDVMACHLAGVTTAVASCGTAFGDEHAKVVRRLLKDHDEFRGEVIFTFDGDAAGQAAALKAFQGDQVFAGQTYVAVEPSGLDPCDLRLKEGDAAVRELVARRTPLYRFVLANVVQRHDLDRADGRVDAMREAARLVTAIRDRSKVDAFARELAGMIGAEPADVQRAVRQAAARGEAPAAAVPGGRRAEAEPTERPQAALPDPRDPRLYLERETLKLVVQWPGRIGRTADDVDGNDFTSGAYRAVWDAVVAAGGTGSADDGWAARLRDRVEHEALKLLVTQLAVEPIRREGEPDDGYVRQHVHRLRELTAQRRIAELKSKLQRTNPVEHAADYNRMFGELVALEQKRRELREKALESAE